MYMIQSCSQGEYLLHVYLDFGDGYDARDAFYHNFSMQDADHKYTIDYNDFFSPDDADNGWPDRPAAFYTNDDNDFCALYSGYDGWMSSTCVSNARLFHQATSSPSPNWGENTLDEIAFVFERTSLLVA